MSQQPVYNKVYKNHNSALSNPVAVRQILQSELKSARIAGPFQSPPFDNFVCSPISLREKKEKGKYRLIHDLSYPHGLSVNSSIPDHAATVQYQLLDHVIQLVQKAGKGAFIAKADIEQAFRLIPIAPQYYNLLVFHFDGKFYYDKCLAMGLRSSCSVFETLSCALQWIMQTQFNACYVSHILDDFIFINPIEQVCQRDLDNFIKLCSDIGIPIKHAKTVSPNTQVEAHGILLDSVVQHAKLPNDKVQKCVHLLTVISRKRKVTLKFLQSLIGTLQFASRAIAPGRAFLRRIINLTIGVNNPYHHISITAEARADIKCWLTFLQDFNGVSLFHKSAWLSSDTVNLHTDSAGSKGFAAVFGQQWFVGSFPSSWESLHITVKELYPIVLAVSIWGLHISNQKILFHTDNQACVHIINSQTSKDKNIMKLVRHMVSQGLRYNVMFRAVHVPGKNNILPDLLSRFQFQRARKIAPWLNTIQTPIPPSLQPQALLGQPLTK